VCVVVGGCFSQRPGPRTLTESTRVFRIVKKGFVVINLVRITEQKIKIKKRATDKCQIAGAAASTQLVLWVAINDAQGLSLSLTNRERVAA
jgi:hypothetical protein